MKVGLNILGLARRAVRRHLVPARDQRPFGQLHDRGHSMQTFCSFSVQIRCDAKRYVF